MKARFTILTIGLAVTALYLANRRFDFGRRLAASHEIRSRNEQAALLKRSSVPQIHASGQARSAPDPLIEQSRGVRRNIFSQGSADFATGEIYNLVVEGTALHIAADATAPADNDEVVGIYISPIRQIVTPEQQQAEAFDKINFDYHSTVPAGSMVLFEFRTIAVDEEGEGWSAWQEITPDRTGAPIDLGHMAEKWQYRVVLTKGASGSAGIRDIKITTYQNPTLAEKIFRYAVQ